MCPVSTGCTLQPLFGGAPCSHGQVLAMHMNRTALFGAMFLYAALLLKSGTDMCAHTRCMAIRVGFLETQGFLAEQQWQVCISCVTAELGVITI